MWFFLQYFYWIFVGVVHTPTKINRKNKLSWFFFLKAHRTCFFTTCNQMKIKEISHCRNSSKFNRNIVERVTFDIPNTHIHDRSLSWQNTGTSVKWNTTVFISNDDVFQLHLKYTFKFFQTYTSLLQYNFIQVWCVSRYFSKMWQC
jgi:hypothetical protein